MGPLTGWTAAPGGEPARWYRTGTASLVTTGMVVWVNVSGAGHGSEPAPGASANWIWSDPMASASSPPGGGSAVMLSYITPRLPSESTNGMAPMPWSGEMVRKLGSQFEVCEQSASSESQ